MDQRTGNSYYQEALPLGAEGNDRGRRRRTLRSVPVPRKLEGLHELENVDEDISPMPNWLQQALEVDYVSSPISLA